VRPIVIAAGGTGGHFFPAEALAVELIARGHRIVLMTDARAGADKSGVFAGHERHVLRGAGIAGRGVRRAGAAMLSLAFGTIQARALLARLAPAAIIGFGGYPSVAPVLAARMLRKRPVVVLHEQNAVLGRANRFLTRFADLLALGFAATSRIPGSIQTHFTGNPVRPPIAAMFGTPYAPPSDRIEIFVVGGSLGARIFSDIVPNALAALASDLRGRLHIVQQCRPEDQHRVAAAYRTAAINAELAPFFSEINQKYAASHLVIARAGASTCAEIAIVGRPAILVPLPSAIDDHQTANARALADAGAATVIPQSEFSVALLAGLLVEKLSDMMSLARSAAASARCANPRSAADLADAVERLIARTELVQ